MLPFNWRQFLFIWGQTIWGYHFYFKGYHFNHLGVKKYGGLFRFCWGHINSHPLNNFLNKQLFYLCQCHTRLSPLLLTVFCRSNIQLLQSRGHKLAQNQYLDSKKAVKCIFSPTDFIQIIKICKFCIFSNHNIGITAFSKGPI
jgi:hypothetical protein